MRHLAFVLLAAVVVSNSAWGYETETHALMTNQAYTQSVLNPTNSGT